MVTIAGGEVLATEEGELRGGTCTSPTTSSLSPSGLYNDTVIHIVCHHSSSHLVVVLLVSANGVFVFLRSSSSLRAAVLASVNLSEN